MKSFEQKFKSLQRIILSAWSENFVYTRCSNTPEYSTVSEVKFWWGAVANKQEDFLPAPNLNVEIRCRRGAPGLRLDPTTSYFIRVFFHRPTRFTPGREDSAKNFAAISSEVTTHQQPQKGQRRALTQSGKGRKN